MSSIQKRVQKLSRRRAIIGEEKGKSYWIYINRPEKLNALDKKTLTRLALEIKKGCNSNSSAVIITGSGRSFSTGADIEDIIKLKNKEEVKEFFDKIKAVMDELVSCPKPIIALVNGLAVGNGAEILLATDVVLASESSWFSFPEISLGIMPATLLSNGGYILGFRKAKYLAITGTRFSAEEAKIMGLVDEVVPQEELEKEAAEIVDILSRYDENTIKAVKKVTKELYWNNIEKVIDIVSELAISEVAKDKMEKFLSHKIKPSALQPRRTLHTY
ncbi:MAG: enoyl-CoA hydratase/isomerase family protein [Caldisphaeraceae archaeon]|nr:enoyl-CoA hydratase/isomerase family protein [Caldisphaeraceae archaeon]MEB3692358.1 enoyl-CoA hydratase/isomerase family protein [Caldisphaeraceae archaeon]MEB3798211.1 enoyl-CoA hydratase/isomerase family protein [Caldisphaeraceae archaeon]